MRPVKVSLNGIYDVNDFDLFTYDNDDDDDGNEGNDFDGFDDDCHRGLFSRVGPINGWRTSHHNTAMMIIHIAR